MTATPAGEVLGLADAPRWDAVADAVVIGLGAAGACAALEAAAAGGSVVVLDRFLGGGSTALSGGVVYAGGGTPQQDAAGVTDTPEAMLAYLRHEVGDAVSEATLRRFCEGSAGDVRWLTGHGVPFSGALCPDKTSYPTNRHFLYFSGSEASGWGRSAAPPAPRGHRVVGRGTSGRVLHVRLAAALARSGVRVVVQTAAREVMLDPGGGGGVVGVRCTTLTRAPAWARLAHRALVRAGAKPFIYAPKVGRLVVALAHRLERRHARPFHVLARRGVVIAAGGFVADRSLMRRHAPDYRGGLPLGTPGDDGAGLRLGTAAGGTTSRLGRVSAWRFLSPPTSLLCGLLVDREGRRICDESLYGAAVGAAIVRSPDRRAWLLIDRAIARAAYRQLWRQTLWFQRIQALYLLAVASVTASTLEGVARRAGVDPEGLRATVERHDEAVGQGLPDPTGKPVEFGRRLVHPPFSLIDVSVRPRIAYPCPMITLGGLVVDEGTGQVLGDDGVAVPGLFAAGRSAVGICSTSYVSGLSLADCVFSGRRAGRQLMTPVRSGPAPAHAEGSDGA